MSGDTWHDHVDATWHLRGSDTWHDSHVVHLCEWLILSQVSSEENNGKDKTRKEEKKKVKMTSGK